MKREHSILLYVISRDVLLALAVVFSGVLVSESLLPGFISGHISLSKVAIITIFPAIFAYYFAKKLSLQATTSTKKMTLFRISGYFFLIAIVVNALRRFSLTFILLSIISFVIILFLLEQDLVNSDQSKAE